MAAYSFITHWRFDAPLERVWREIDAPECYPQWWPAMRVYRDLTPLLHGVGSRAERVTKGVLPYELRYTTTTARYEPRREIAYDVEGDLTGDGRMVLRRDGTGTAVDIYWDVATSGFWLNLLAPVLKPLLAWNHNWVMAQGERGLAQRLATNTVGREDAKS
jgi:hypothetical protein